MISLAVLAFATFASPLSAPTPSASVGYANDTVAHMKGHPAIPARKARSTHSAAPTVCNSDPMKGRACRHHVAKAEEKASEVQLAAVGKPALAVRDAR